MRKPRVEIIYKDDDIFVINKASGVSVTKDRSGKAQLLDILTEQLGAEAAGKLRLVHRLDKDTSGVMILAKNLETQSRFSSYFEKKFVEKTYLALVTGPVPDRQGRIDAPLAQNSKKPGLMHVAGKRGKEAITNWKLLADFGAVSLLAVHPLTGRTHQIRVHLPNIGLPLAIDPLYGSNRPLFLSDFKPDYRLARGKTEKPLIDRLTLHAYQLQLPNPELLPAVIPAKLVLDSDRGAEIHSNHSHPHPDCFVAGLDKKFTAALKMLTKHNPKGLDAFFNPDDFSKITNALSLA